MKEYLVQLKGTYCVDEMDKNNLSGLSLSKVYYKIDENLNIRVDYMSFLVQSNNEREVVLSEEFYSKIREGLIDSGYDEEYIKAGAQIFHRHEDVFAEADLLLKVKEPLPEEYRLLKPGQVVFTYLHLAASEELTRNLLERKIGGMA